MSIKALIIEGGETVIADVQEVHDKEKQEFLGYRVTNPYVAELVWDSRPDAPVDGTDINGRAQGAEVNFRYWAPLSSAREFDFVKDYVRVIYDVHEDTLKLYASVIAHQQEHFENAVSPELSKTVVSVASDESVADVAKATNQAFDS